IGDDLNSNGNVTLTLGAKIGDDLTHSPGTTVNIVFGQVMGSTIVAPVVAHPTPFVPVTLPPPTAFSAGGPDAALPVFASQTLPPGPYGHLTLAGSNTVNFSSGDYFFDDMTTLSSFVNFNFNATSGAVRLFAKGNVSLNELNTKLNGVDFENLSPSAS